MPRAPSRLRPRTLRGRLLLSYALVTLGVLLVLAVVLDRERVIPAGWFALAALTGVAVLAVVSRGVSRPLRQMAASVARVGEGDDSTGVPEEGAEELQLLAGAVNRMRAEVAARIDSVQVERAARDAILSSLEEGVILFGVDGTVRYRNASADRLLDGVPDRLGDLTPPSLRKFVLAAEGGHPVAPTEVETGTLSRRTLLTEVLPVPGEQGLLLVLRDVTEARSLDAVRRDFVTNASHELKTPAASIQALAETIAWATIEDPPAAARFAGQLEREAARLSRLISDLLDLSRLEGGPGERREVRLDQVVAEESDRHRVRAQEAGLSFTVDADERVTVIGSAGDLALVVRNLVENAVQYTRPGGGIHVEVGVEGDQAVLRVRDTGIGIPSRDRSRIFERFYRIDRARSRDTGGTGLGLSIVRHVAESHGGTVAVDSALGEGTTFTVRLPAVSSPQRRDPSRAVGSQSTNL